MWRTKFFLFCLVIPLIVKSQENISQTDSIYPKGNFVASISGGIFFYSLPVLIPQVGYKWKKHLLLGGVAFFVPYAFSPDLYFDVKYSYSFFSKNKSSCSVGSMIIYSLKGINFGVGLTPALEYQRKLSERLRISGLLGLNFFADQYAFVKSPAAMLDFAYTFNRRKQEKHEKK